MDRKVFFVQRNIYLYIYIISNFRVDPLYAFFVQWKPEIYGDDDDMMAEKRGFVVLSEDAEESGDIEILDEYFGGGSLQKDWEVKIYRNFEMLLNGGCYLCDMSNNSKLYFSMVNCN